jgi:hypothetical protein
MSEKNSRDSKRFAASRGEMVGAVPAGYRWEGEGRDRKLMIDEPVADIVRRVFAEYGTGRYSTRDIAQRLNREGLTLPRFQGGWRGDTVAQVLGNLAYHGRKYSESRTRRQGKVIPAQWPAIVDEETWESVQRLLSRFHRKGGRRNQREGGEREYLFRGLLRCAQCGGKLHSHTLRYGAYYRCRGNDRAEACKKGIRDDVLTKWAEYLFAALASVEPDGFAAAVADLVPVMDGTAPSDALADIDRQLERIGWRFDNGYMLKDQYEFKWAQLQKSRADVVARHQTPATPRLVDRIDGLLSLWRGGSVAARRAVLLELFEEIDVQEGRIVTLKPRDDAQGRAAEVEALLRQIDSWRSPGGIRTRDLSLERAAS